MALLAGAGLLIAAGLGALMLTYVAYASWAAVSGWISKGFNVLKSCWREAGLTLATSHLFPLTFVASLALIHFPRTTVEMRPTANSVLNGFTRRARSYLLSRCASGFSKVNPNRRGFSPITAADTM